MFHRHFDDHVRHGHGGFGRGPFHRWRERGGGMGRREGRMFDAGELRLVILALVAQKPRYGYEIIKELGKRVGGEYSPSPGVVYPTLTMLEEMGYASASQDQAGRKLYTLHPRRRKDAGREQGPGRRDLRALRRSRRGGRRPRHGLGPPRDDEPARRNPPAPARPGRDPRADPGDRRRARHSGENDRADLIRPNGLFLRSRAAASRRTRSQAAAPRGVSQSGIAGDALDFEPSAERQAAAAEG